MDDLKQVLLEKVQNGRRNRPMTSGDSDVERGTREGEDREENREKAKKDALFQRYGSTVGIPRG